MVEQLFTVTGEDKGTGRDKEAKVRTAKSETAPKTLVKTILKATAAIRCQTGGNAYHRGLLIQPPVFVPDRQPTYANRIRSPQVEEASQLRYVTGNDEERSPPTPRGLRPDAAHCSSRYLWSGWLCPRKPKRLLPIVRREDRSPIDCVRSRF